MGKIDDNDRLVGKDFAVLNASIAMDYGEINMTRFRPLGARVLVRRTSLPEQTRSGLFILGREYPTEGIVVAIGPGRKSRLHPSRRIHLPEALDGTLAVGQMVMFHREAIRQALTFEFAGDTYVLLEHEHCLVRYKIEVRDDA